MPWLTGEFDLLQGQPGELRRMAMTARSMADRLSDSARAIEVSGHVDRGSWSGAAADGWAQRIADLPGRVARSSEHLHVAADVLDRFANHLDDAQAQVAAARTQASSLPHDPPDATAEAERTRLLHRANSARRDAATANADAQHGFDSVTTGARFAPRGGGGGLLGHLDRAIGGATDAVGGQMMSFGRGVYDGTVGTAVSITTLAVEAGKYAAEHPGDLADGGWEVLTRPDHVIEAVWENKGALASAAVNWDTLRNDPARWLGQLAPTVLLAATGGGAAARLQQAARESDKLGPMVRGAQAITGLTVAAEAPATAASATWTVAGNLARSEVRNTELIKEVLQPAAPEPASPPVDPPTSPCPAPSVDQVAVAPVAP
ncbi:MAG: hypothetical protein AB7V43_10930 [Acidimicrobiia bacterium]